MTPRQILESLGHREKLENLSRDFGLPHCPEYDIGYFSNLWFPELDRALGALDKAADPESLVCRGRIRRLIGDSLGAAQDLRAALDLVPDLAEAHAYLGEIELSRPEALLSLEKAVSLKPALACARLYLGAALLVRGRFKESLAPLAAAAKLEPAWALPHLLVGRALERMKEGRGAYASYLRAGRLAPVCSAAHLLASRSAPSPALESHHVLAAYDVSPVLGFITLQIHQTLAVDSLAYLRRIRSFCFHHPAKVAAYYRREATQSHFSHFPAEDYGFVRRLVARHPRLAWAQAFYGRAACYTPQGAPEGVERLTKAIALRPEAGWTRAWRANAWRMTGKPENAQADFADSIRLQPFYHRAFVWRGSLLRKLGRLPQALADLDRAAAMDPYYSLTFHERSLTRRELGDPVGSVLDLDRAFLLDHRYSWVYKTGREPSPKDMDLGLSQLDRAVRRHPGVSSLRVWRGQLRMLRGLSSAAMEDLEAAVQDDPHQPLAWAWRGRALATGGQAEAAVASLQKALELLPSLWVAYGWLAEAQWDCGQRARARATLKRVLARKPQTPWAYCLRARFDAALGRPRAALDSVRRALLIDGKSPEAYILAASIRLSLGDVRGARRAADRCLEIAPTLGRAHLLSASIAEREGRHDKAVKGFRAALNNHPYLFNPKQKLEMKRLLEAAPEA